MGTRGSVRRLFVIGAGFSVPANLPKASQLADRVVSNLAHIPKFAQDLRNYCEFRRIRKIKDLEDFVAFLDIEHFLRLRGSKEWSRYQGNESQIFIRREIGRLIHNATPKAADLPPAYFDFAERLNPGDVILTFNYDLVLERALAHVGKPFRRFWQRYTAKPGSDPQPEMNEHEVVIIKLHGSVDWSTIP